MSETPPVEARPTVHVQHVNHSFGEGEARKQVLFDNTLALLPGEITIMTGPSGSGKTTLLTLIGALRSVQEGSVQVQGRELHGLPPRDLVDVRRHIGFIFQAHNLFESLTALQNVMLALELHSYTYRQRRELAAAMLTILGLGNRLSYKPHALSGGQRQRVAIARALVHRPGLILADEPTAALDEDTGREVVTLLQQLAVEAQTTILIVTHDNRIIDVADRLVNMIDGHIISNVAVQESVSICEFLAQCPIFVGFTPNKLSVMAERVTRASYAAGTVIIRQGEVGEDFFLVRQGHVDVIVDDGSISRVVNTLGRGEFFGEAALMTGAPRNATVQARGAVELYVLGRTEFQTALDTNISFREELRKVFFQRH